MGVERVDLWLQEKQRAVTNLEKIRLSSADVEKQAEKVKVRGLVKWSEKDMWV